jgi:hypothetical protein
MDGPAPARRDLVAGTVLLLLAGGYLAASLRYPLGALADPGPAVFPLAVGLLLLMLAAIQVVEAGRALRRGGPSEAGAPARDEDRAGRSGLPLIMVAGLVVYLLAMPWLGFYPASVLLVIFSSQIMGTRGWGVHILLAAGVLLVCVLVFTLWLKMPLPRGVLQ